MIFGNKVIKVEVLDEKNKLIVSAEKGFVVPKNIMSEEDSIIMIKGRDLPELEHNTIVSVITTTKTNDRIRYSGAVAVSLDTQLNIKVLRANDTKLLAERRRFYKIKIRESGKALFFVRDEKTVRFDEPISVEIHDINVGGVLLQCKYEFILDDLLCVEISLFDDYPLNAAVRIIRIQRDDEDKIEGYGCEFQGLTAAQEDYIGRYILKVQSEKRQRLAAREEKF